MCIHQKRGAAATADSNANTIDQVEMAPHHCRMVATATGMTDTTEPAAITGTITASINTTPRGKEHSAIATASASSCDAVVVGDKRTPTMDADPCFPACLGADQVENNHHPRVTMASDIVTSEDKTTTPSTVGRRSRRNSRQMSADNQHTHHKSSPLDLEDAAAHHVLATVDYLAVPAPPASIVVDYDEGMPERSRTALLLGDGGDTQRMDCAPEACNPLDLLAFEELSIGDVDKDTRIRPRLGSGTGNMPKTPSSRRGKSVILSATAVPIQEPAPVKQLEPKQPLVTEEDTKGEPERCSTAHKLCLCDVGLHKSQESCWLVANGSVYDVTGLLDAHPAGPRSILRKAGGADCTKDMKFHSKAARKMLEKCFIGKLEPCGEDPERASGEQAACAIM